jgi:mono/diheme cytochrome c family protein
LFQIIALALAMIYPAVARSLEPEPAVPPGALVLSGRADYLVHCASCHGINGEGDGPVAGVLKVKTPDLTLLSRSNQGSFPEKHVFDTIDGSVVVEAHGTRDMPVWGEFFPMQALNAANKAQTEREVNARIQRLVDYLKAIQRQ